MAKGSISNVSFDRPLNLKSIDEVAEWAANQFANVERVLNQELTYAMLLPTRVEPVRPREGMVVFVADPDGQYWDPGSNDTGGYFGYYNGGWVRLG